MFQLAIPFVFARDPRDEQVLDRHAEDIAQDEAYLATRARLEMLRRVAAETRAQPIQSPFTRRALAHQLPAKATPSNDIAL